MSLCVLALVSGCGNSGSSTKPDATTAPLVDTVTSLCGEPPPVVPIALNLADLGSGSGYLMGDAQWETLNQELLAEAEWRTCVLAIRLPSD